MPNSMVQNAFRGLSRPFAATRLRLRSSGKPSLRTAPAGGKVNTE